MLLQRAHHYNDCLLVFNLNGNYVPDAPSFCPLGPICSILPYRLWIDFGSPKPQNDLMSEMKHIWLHAVQPRLIRFDLEVVYPVTFDHHIGDMLKRCSRLEYFHVNAIGVTQRDCEVIMAAFTAREPPSSSSAVEGTTKSKKKKTKDIPMGVMTPRWRGQLCLPAGHCCLSSCVNNGTDETCHLTLAPSPFMVQPERRRPLSGLPLASKLHEQKMGHDQDDDSVVETLAKKKKKPTQTARRRSEMAVAPNGRRSSTKKKGKTSRRGGRARGASVAPGTALTTTSIQAVTSVVTSPTEMSGTKRPRSPSPPVETLSTMSPSSLSSSSSSLSTGATGELSSSIIVCALFGESKRSATINQSSITDCVNTHAQTNDVNDTGLHVSKKQRQDSFGSETNRHNNHGAGNAVPPVVIVLDP
jgi:hypothetical protein